MFEQLKLLLNRQSLRGEENQGRVLDWLKQIGHFKRLDSHLGSDYLLVLLPILQPFVLRKGFTLINENDLYVLLQGDLRASQALLGGNICVQCGICIDLKNSRNLIYAAFNDCKMIRILRNAGNMVKTYKKLQELERQRVKKFKEYQKLITQPWNQMKLGIISRSAFFSKLGQYDAYQFALGCSFKEYSQFMVTHEGSGSYNKIGYIVSGKIKMSLLNGQDHRKDQLIYWFLNQGDWIGLEDYLWNKSQESSGEVQTTAAAILWIPFYIFQAKFNARTNCDTINKLIGLIKTKKLLFDRSVNCRRKKYQEMEIQANSKLQLNPQLQAKIQALQPQPERKKTYFSKNRVDSSNKREVTYPQTILHTQMQTNEPRIPPHFDSKTIVLFPEEYANSPVDPSYQKQMNRIKFIIDKTKEKQRQSSIELSPQINYNTICQRITFRIKQQNRSRQLTPQRKISQEKKTHRKSSNHHSYKTRLHLYNDTPPKTKTLQILT